MTRRTTDKHRTVTVEVRLQLQPEHHADLCSAAKVSGLAASQYVRALVLNHLAKIYQNEKTQ